MPKPDKGVLVSFEGVEGCGKTSQIKLLEKYLISRSFSVTVVKNPGGTVIGQRVREILLDPINTNMSLRTEVFLHAASLRQSYEDIIRPSLAQGQIVLVDRFIDSAIVYQGIVRGVGVNFVEEVIYNKALDNLTPNLTLLLDMPANLVYSRTQGRSSVDSRIEQESVDFHNRVRDGYLRIAAIDCTRVQKIDATYPTEVVQAEIIEKVEKYIILERLT